MSKVTKVKRVTVPWIKAQKAAGQKLTMVTCYDASFGRIVEESPIDMVLVGDSLGNVMMGFNDPIPVTVDHILHHTTSVSRVLKRAHICADMPFMSYTDVGSAVRNATRMIQEGGAHSVKMEGGHSIIPQVKKLVDLGIPVMGHLGLTPQSVHTLGGYKVQAKTEKEQAKLFEDAKALEKAGAFALVLEMVPGDLAQEVSKSLSIPTIGIGAGPACDGQVLVMHDLLGFDQGFNPKFLKKYLNLGELITSALTEYDSEVKGGKFPEEKHTF